MRRFQELHENLRHVIGQEITPVSGQNLKFVTRGQLLEIGEKIIDLRIANPTHFSNVRSFSML